MKEENGKRMLGCRKRSRDDEFDSFDEVVKKEMHNPHPQKQQNVIRLALFTVTVALLVVRVFRLRQLLHSMT